MSALTAEQLAVIALVGSDASYADAAPFRAGSTQSGPNLQSYPETEDCIHLISFRKATRRETAILFQNL